MPPWAVDKKCYVNQFLLINHPGAAGGPLGSSTDDVQLRQVLLEGLGGVIGDLGFGEIERLELDQSLEAFEAGVGDVGPAKVQDLEARQTFLGLLVFCGLIGVDSVFKEGIVFTPTEVNFLCAGPFGRR